MGKGREQMRRIEDKASRQVCFSKRKGGLLKKAKELAVLCDIDVGLIIFSAKGKLYEYSSAPSMDTVIQRYQEFSDAEKDLHKDKLEAQNQQNPNASESHVEEFAHPRSNGELMEIAQRYLDDTNMDQLSATELGQIEKKIDGTLKLTMSRKENLMMDSIAKLREKENLMMDSIAKLREKGKILQQRRQFLESLMEREETAEKESDHHQTAAEG